MKVRNGLAKIMAYGIDWFRDETSISKWPNASGLWFRRMKLEIVIPSITQNSHKSRLIIRSPDFISTFLLETNKMLYV